MVYSTFDWGIRDEDGYYYILGRTDDVINVAGHRLGTREIEESISSHPNVAEVAVVGVADSLKGQVAMAFVVPRDASAIAETRRELKLEGDIMKVVDEQLGAVARPVARPFRQPAAQDPQRQAAAPRHPGRCGRARPRRPDDHRRPDCAATDSRPDGFPIRVRIGRERSSLVSRSRPAAGAPRNVTVANVRSRSAGHCRNRWHNPVRTKALPATVASAIRFSRVAEGFLNQLSLLQGDGK